MNSVLRTTLALGLAWIAGCGGGVDAQPEVAARSVLTAAPSAGLQPNLLQALRRIARAPSLVPFRGVRRVEQHWSVDDQPRDLIYRESVDSDATGRFAVEPTEVLAPTMSSVQASLFLVLQTARAGFVQRYRDFAVRDLDSFALNYSIASSGALVTVAGRPCQEYLVQRVVDNAVRYWIAVDRETSLVLRTRFETATGDLLSLVEFETLDLAPDFTNVVWRQPITDEQPLSADPTQARVQLGFEPRLPKSDGSRFALERATAVRAANPSGGPPQMWAKHVLTDGVEVVFFLHGGADPFAGRDDVARVAPSVGPWNTVEGSLHGERFMAMGRTSVDDLLDLLESVL